MRTLLIIILVSCLLSACGQSGKLFLPNKTVPVLPDNSQEDNGEKV